MDILHLHLLCQDPDHQDPIHIHQQVKILDILNPDQDTQMLQD